GVQTCALPIYKNKVENMRILVTGGAGFIGSAVVRHVLSATEHEVINVDKLSYASNFEAVAAEADIPRYHFQRADISDAAAVQRLFSHYQPDASMPLPAESLVDRSNAGPAAFAQSSLLGTYPLLEAARPHWRVGDKTLRLLHHSTDGVYGDLAD